MSIGAAGAVAPGPATGASEPVAIDWEEEDLKLAPIALLLTTSGTLAIILALLSASSGSGGASALVPAALVLLSSGHALTAARRWTVRLGQLACLLAAGIWLVTMAVVTGAGEITAFCLAMVGAAECARRFLGAQLHAPEWMGETVPAPADDALRSGWIEELPDGMPANEFGEAGPADPPYGAPSIGASSSLGPIASS